MLRELVNEYKKFRHPYFLNNDKAPSWPPVHQLRHHILISIKLYACGLPACRKKRVLSNALRTPMQQQSRFLAVRFALYFSE